jgi:hypothetical protein
VGWNYWRNTQYVDAPMVSKHHPSLQSISADLADLGRSPQH